MPGPYVRSLPPRPTPAPPPHYFAIVGTSCGRCLVAECRSEVVTAALGGVNPHVFLQLGQAERKRTLDGLIGREVRCVVGCNNHGNEESAGRVEFSVERIASANPAADLAHLLSPE